MKSHEKILESIDSALEKSPVNALGSCTPQKGEAYDCMNCMKMNIERDGCFTEHMKKYGYKKQKDMCPGYEPPKNGIFVLVMSGPINCSGAEK
jgi:hypothetical protein